MRKLATIAAAVLTSLASLWADPAQDAASTVVIYNRNDAGSRNLAKFYAEQRHIPFNQVLGLNCSSDEEISRDQYLVTIEAPLRSAFTKRGWWTVELNSEGRREITAADKRFLAIIRGVPLKIRPDGSTPASQLFGEIKPGTPLATLVKHNEASVDSELAAMFALLEEAPACIPNPYFRRFTSIYQTPPGQAPLLVCRLDGPSEEIVRGMIENAVATEEKGLWGWAYVDTRSIKSPAYKPGDDWLLAAAAFMRKQGIPVITDVEPATLPAEFPVTEAAVYYGWYSGDVDGPFANSSFRFEPGAIAVHLHSFSARTLRDPRKAWAAPLLARGATVTIGNVYEPYLGLTVNFDILQDRLMSGLTLGEAAYAAFRGVSWMGVILGDPLYRPYARWFELEASSTDSIWEKYREIVLSSGGDPVAAAEALRKLAADTGNSMPLEALGQAQAAAGGFAAALESYAAAAKLETSEAIRFRLTIEQIQLLRRMKRKQDALTMVSNALEEFRSDSRQAWLGRVVLELSPKKPQ